MISAFLWSKYRFFVYFINFLVSEVLSEGSEFDIDLKFEFQHLKYACPHSINRASSGHTKEKRVNNTGCGAYIYASVNKFNCVQINRMNLTTALWKKISFSVLLSFFSTSYCFSRIINFDYSLWELLLWRDCLALCLFTSSYRFVNVNNNTVIYKARTLEGWKISWGVRISKIATEGYIDF